MQLSLSLDFQKLSSYNIIINVAAALKAGLWSRSINRTLTCGIGTLLSSIICVHSFVSGGVCSCLYHTKKNVLFRTFLFVGSEGRIIPLRSIHCAHRLRRPAHHVCLSLVVKPTSRWFSSGYHTKKNVLFRTFFLLVARVGFEPTTRGL